MEVLKFDSNVIIWHGYFSNSIEGQKHLEEKVAYIAKSKRIVSAKKVLVNRRLHGLFLFKYTVITAPIELHN